MRKIEKYQHIIKEINSLITGETDEIAIMATVACELFHAFRKFNWVGFYRVVQPRVLKIGPYQGTHGCLVIPFERGVCGKCADTQQTQIVPDVSQLPYHIACSSATKSEIVVPVFNRQKHLIAVLDIDSNDLNAFDYTDQEFLERICTLIEHAVA